MSGTILWKLYYGLGLTYGHRLSSKNSTRTDSYRPVRPLSIDSRGNGYFKDSVKNVVFVFPVTALHPLCWDSLMSHRWTLQGGKEVLPGPFPPSQGSSPYKL